MKVIVYGTNHYNTLNLVRSLGEENYYVILLLIRDKITFVDKSKYVKECIFIERDTDIVETIKTISAKYYDEKIILFTSGDNEASFVNSHFKELNKYIVTEGGLCDNDINKYRDKNASNQLAGEIGFNIPKTWIINNEKEVPDCIQYPILVKANNSIYGGKNTLAVINNIDELKTKLATISSENYPVQVQEYIDKEYEIMLQGCSLNNGKDIICEIANRKLRHYPNPYSAGSFSYSVKVDSNPELIELRILTSKYLKRTNYSGLFSAEFIYCNNKYYFLEINFRNDGTSYLSTSCGCNLADAFCKWQMSIQNKEFKYKAHKYINLLNDINHVRKGNISFFKWIFQFMGRKCYSHFNWKDIKPFYYYLKSKKII